MKEAKTNLWAWRNAIKDCIQFEHISVTDKQTCMEMIDKSEVDVLITLAESFYVDDEIGQTLLENLYSEKIKGENSSVHYINENDWNVNRHNVITDDRMENNQYLLTEAEGDKSGEEMLADQIIHAVKHSTLPAAGLILLNGLARGDIDPKKVEGFIKRKSASTWNAISKLPYIRKVFEKTNDPKFAEKVNRFRKEYQNLKFAEKVEGKVNKAAKVGAVVLTITAVVALAYKAYAEYFDKHAQACKGKKGKERQICKLVSKMNGCDEAIKTLQQKYKADDEKSREKLKRHIWKWGRRKQRYKEKLVSLKQQSPSTKNAPVFSSSRPYTS